MTRKTKVRKTETRKSSFRRISLDRTFLNITLLNWAAILAVYMVTTAFAIIFAQITSTFNTHEVFSLGLEQVTSNSELLRTAGQLATQTHSKVLMLVAGSVLLVGIIASTWSHFVRKALVVTRPPTNKTTTSMIVRWLMPLLFNLVAASIIFLSTKLVYPPTIPIISLMVFFALLYVLNLTVFTLPTSTPLISIIETASKRTFLFSVIIITSLVVSGILIAIVYALSQLILPVIVAILLAATGPSIVHTYALLTIRRVL